MNCSEFQEIVQDLAKTGNGAPAGSDVVGMKREHALAHARMCANCDSVLVEATALTASLRALGASHARAEAPAHVEQALLAAYRQHRASEPKPISVRWRMPASVAGLAVAAGLALAIIWYHPTSYQPANKAAVSQTILSSATGPASQSKPTQTGQSIAQTDAASSAGLTSNASGPPSKKALAESNTTDAGSLESLSATTGAFMALPYADAGPIEDATVVRVEMPGSALGSFGLPVTDGAAEGRVVADFIVGEDGTPEAIRIVR